MADPKDQKIGAIVAGIIYLVGDYVESDAKRESPGPGTTDQDETDDPENDRQFVGMKKEEELPIEMIIGGLEEFLQGKCAAPEHVKILEKMIQIDKDSGEKARRRRGNRPGE